jgi:hypothetical protein
LYNIVTGFGFPMNLAKLIQMCLSETYSRARVGKHLCDIFPIRNCLKKVVLSPFLFSTLLSSTPLREFHVNQDAFTNQRLVYTDDVNILHCTLIYYKQHRIFNSCW